MLSLALLYSGFLVMSLPNPYLCYFTCHVLIPTESTLATLLFLTHGYSFRIECHLQAPGFEHLVPSCLWEAGSSWRK